MIFLSDLGSLKNINSRKSCITVFKHQVQVKLVEQEFMAIIGFSKNLGIGFNILGRESFFDRFVFCFDEKNKVLIIK